MYIKHIDIYSYIATKEKKRRTENNYLEKIITTITTTITIIIIKTKSKDLKKVIWVGVQDLCGPHY